MRSLNEAQKTVPPRAERTAGAAQPRRVTVSGCVYEDRNANGSREPDEPGLADVIVTDGVHVFRTPRDGGYRFEMQVGQDRHQTVRHCESSNRLPSNRRVLCSHPVG